MKGVKEPPYRESGYQTTLKEWFQTYETNEFHRLLKIRM